MKTTDYKTSKELTDALKGAGYEFVKDTTQIIGFDKNGIACGKKLSIGKIKWNEIPAYTMIELWEMLPDRIGRAAKEIHDSDKVTYADYDVYGPTEYIENNICNALARLAIWCVNNGHELNMKSQAIWKTK